MESKPTERRLPRDELLEQICEDERADILQRVRDLASTDDQADASRADEAPITTRH